MKITRKTTIGAILEKHPELIETLFSLGLHCAGCHIAQQESIEDGLKNHGMTEKEIDETIKTLNKKIK